MIQIVTAVDGNVIGSGQIFNQRSSDVSGAQKQHSFRLIIVVANHVVLRATAKTNVNE